MWCELLKNLHAMDEVADLRPGQHLLFLNTAGGGGSYLFLELVFLCRIGLQSLRLYGVNCVER